MADGELTIDSDSLLDYSKRFANIISQSSSNQRKLDLDYRIDVPGYIKMGRSISDGMTSKVMLENGLSLESEQIQNIVAVMNNQDKCMFM